MESSAVESSAVERKGEEERGGYEGGVRDFSSYLVKVLHSQMERE